MEAPDILIIEQARASKIENEVFLRNIRTLPAAIFYEELKQVHNQIFEKTDCLSCANCCKSSPPLITKSDIKRISAHIQVSPKNFERKYVITDFNGEMSFSFVPCRFLNEDNSCSIYEVRPEACRRFPHTDEKAYPERTKLNILNTQVCPAAAKILIQLKQKFHNYDL